MRPVVAVRRRSVSTQAAAIKVKIGPRVAGAVDAIAEIVALLIRPRCLNIRPFLMSL